MRQRLRDGARHGAQRGQVMAKKGATTITAMIRQYGPVFIGTYATVYFTTLGALFLGVDSGLLDPVSLLHWLQSTTSAATDAGAADTATPKSTVHVVVEFLEHYSWTAKFAPIVEKNPHVANLAVSWIAIKFTEPVRLAFTLAIVPRLARYFGFVVKKTPEEDHVDDDDDHPEDANTATTPTDQHAAAETKTNSPSDTLRATETTRVGDERVEPTFKDEESYIDESKKAQKGSL